MSVKNRLIVMNFMIFAVWGAYLCSLGIYLQNINMGSNIGYFFAVQGVVSLIMPALIGIIADKWVPAQKMLGICHLLCAFFIAAAGYMGMTHSEPTFNQLFWLYSASVAFFMPTIALGNSVSYNALTKAGLDTVKAFPPIRVWGTVGFIVSMWIVDLTGAKENYMQLFISAIWGVLLGIYSFTLPNCPVQKGKSSSLVEALGLRAFALFKQKKMAIFFIFSFLLGMCLQVTNGFAGTFLGDFGKISEYADTFAVQHNIILSSLSQISETLCILLIPFFLKRFGIKVVMMIAMLAWALRFGFFGLGNPGGGVWLFILSMIVYGVAFDFFNISGSLFVDKETDSEIRSSAQGVFMMMTNGLGATVGSLCAQVVVDKFVNCYDATDVMRMQGWSTAWYMFAAFALIVAVLFAVLFKYKHTREE
ncbi:MAG: nucleoside permease [Bacteroidales bacterium]|nr:nucleoside permease [Bacteroidales bacterium]